MTDRRAAFNAQLDAAATTLARLQQLNPMLIDVSLREPCFSAYLGHTLEQKLQILPLVDGFGFKNKIVATFDYEDPLHEEVEDQFLAWLNEHQYDLTGALAASQVGKFGPDGVFIPDVSMQKVVKYGVPNTLHEIYLLPAEQPFDVVAARVRASVAWLRSNMTGDGGGVPRIYMNVVDLADAFFKTPQLAFDMLMLLAEENVTGLSFEDDRGTYFPFQIGAVVRAAKAVLREGQQVLFHCHAGNGMENASAIEALLAGADGYWGGMEKESSTIGHASLGELIANLVRVGNANMEQYRLDQLLPVVHAMHEINHNEPTPRTWPIAGTDAYREMLVSFRQVPDRFMDLPPEKIGGAYTYRIAPTGSDVDAICGRVAELLGTTISNTVANKMILLMRTDLLNGVRMSYDDTASLRQLLHRAQTRLGMPLSDI